MREQTNERKKKKLIYSVLHAQKGSLVTAGEWNIPNFYLQIFTDQNREENRRKQTFNVGNFCSHQQAIF
jgi:hypothetical protein